MTGSQPSVDYGEKESQQGSSKYKDSGAGVSLGLRPLKTGVPGA